MASRRSLHRVARAAPASLVFLLSAAFSGGGRAVAQVQFTELPKQHVPQTAATTMAVLFVDADRDGRADLVLANLGQNRFYRNVGGARFVDETATRLPVDTGDTFAVSAGDVDGDGDADLVFGNGRLAGQRTRLLLNDGRGRFTDATATNLPADSDATRALLLADVDKDGDLDLVLANMADFFGRGGQNRIYLNDGRGKFTDVTAANLPVALDDSHGVAAGDVTGDGKLDLVFANEPSPARPGRNSLWIGDGKGKFRAAASKMTADQEKSHSVALGDVDGDGDLDLVVGNEPRFTGTKFVGGQTQLQVNDGTGKFTDVTARVPRETDATRGLVLVDVDGDGDLDLALANGSTGSEQRNRLWINDGTGRFKDRTNGRFGFAIAESAGVAAGDADGDRDPDLAFANVGRQLTLLLDDGRGMFVDATATPLPNTVGDTLALELADLDRDGDLDLLAGSFFANALFLNDGTGSFTDMSSRLVSGNHLTPAIAVGDVDGDGDADVLYGNFGTRNQLFLNDGRAKFKDATASHLPVTADRTASLALFDADGDGDLDLFAGNAPNQANSGQNRLYLNNGRGIFSDATLGRLPADRDSTFAVAVADVTGDGKLDVVVGNWGQPDRLYTGNGAGKFTDATAGMIPVRSDRTRCLALADVDRDGDLDLVAGVDGRQNRLLVNNGSGKFTDVTTAKLPVDSDDTRSVRFLDVDGDGDPDLFLANASTLGGGGQNRLYLNDGRGKFTDLTVRLPRATDDTFASAAGDVDGDADPDLIAGNAGRNKLLFNLHRQLSTPFVALAGAAYRLDIDVEPGYATGAHLVAPFLSLGKIPGIRLPGHGVLRLDPATLIPLPAGSIPTPGGWLRIPLFLPNLVALRGRSIYTQAVVLPVSRPLSFRLTGLAQDAILF